MTQLRLLLTRLKFWMHSRIQLELTEADFDARIRMEFGFEEQK